MLSIEFLSDERKEKIYLEEGEYSIGRGGDNDIIIKSLVVSRKHCKIFYDRGDWYIKDLGSKNGTFISNTPINGEPYRIKNNEKGILAGDIIMRFKLDEEHENELIDFPVEIDIESDKTKDSIFTVEFKKGIHQILILPTVDKMIEELKSYTSSVGVSSYGVFKKSKDSIQIIFHKNTIPSTEVLLKKNVKFSDDYFLSVKPLLDKKNNVFYYIKYANSFVYEEILNEFKAILKIIYFSKISENLTKIEHFISINGSGANKKIIAVSSIMKEIIAKAIKYASLGAHILIRGESGTGKELIAELIKRESPRKNQRSETTLISGIESGVLDSELFGHKKGAFTGADNDHKGVFERNDGGIVFIDEVSLLPPKVQEKLLRTIEYGDIYPLGMPPKKVDVQIIFATNEDLEKLIKEGRFRKDFYYRISAIEINVPPLRERREDILPIFEYYMKIFSENYNKKYNGLDTEVAEMLLNYPWDGNVRELKNVSLVSAANFTSGKKVEVNDLPRKIIEYFAKESKVTESKHTPILNIKNALAEKEKEMIIKALKLAQGNRKKAAKLLGYSRSLLYKKIKELFSNGELENLKF